MVALSEKRTFWHQSLVDWNHDWVPPIEWFGRYRGSAMTISIRMRAAIAETADGEALEFYIAQNLPQRRNSCAAALRIIAISYR
jgi:hypothetical protein